MEEVKTTTVHVIRAWPIFFKDLENSTKTFEFRKDDRDYEVGNILEIHEYDDYTEHYSGKVLSFEIIHLLRNGKTFGLRDFPAGYVIMSIKSISPDPKA